MAITEKDVPTEILIRYRLDGSGLQGASLGRQTLRLEEDGSEAGPAIVGNLFPLTLTGTDDFALPTVLTQVLADALAAITPLNAQIETLTRQSFLAESVLERAALGDTVPGLQEQIAALQSTLAQAQAANAVLAAQVAAQH